MWYNKKIVNKPVIITIFIVAIGIIGVLHAPTANAVKASEMTPSQSAQNWAAFNGFSTCIGKQNMAQDSTREAVNSGIWFPHVDTGASYPKFGFFYAGSGINSDVGGNPKNEVNCADEHISWITGAWDLWELPGDSERGVQLICKLGATRTADKSMPCLAGGDGFEGADGKGTELTKSKLKDVVIAQTGAYPGDISPQHDLGAPAKYFYYKSVFLQGCLTPDNQTVWTGAAPSNPDAGDSFYYKDIKLVDKDGNLTVANYVGARNHDYKVWAYTSAGDERDHTQKCMDIANIVNANAAAYKLKVDSLPDGDTEPVRNPGDTNAASTCAIGGIGWIVCPVINFMASIADSAYGFLADNFLSVKIEMFDTGSSTYSAWSIMRNFANVAFVIAFLIIVFSQLTGFGIANYGIKKLLPRIIIAAILVNISYFICQLGVDLSNIMGKSLNDLFGSLAVATGNQSTGLWSGGSWTSIAGGILATAVAGAAIWASLSALIPILILAVFALVMVLFILMARQALIILLVVISPLAFVAYLLPNTEQWFTKWRKLLTTLLLLYPIVALVHGVSLFASKILAGVMNTGSLSTRTLGQIAAASVVVLPLFLIPSLLKKSMDGIGNIGATLNNLGSKAGKAAGKRAVSDKNILGQSLARKDAMANIRRQQKQGGTYEKGLNRKAYDPRGWRTRASRGFNALGASGAVGDQRAAAGYAATVALQDEENTRAETRLKSMGLSQDETRRLARGDEFTSASGVSLSGKRDRGMRDAATKQMVASNDVQGMKQLWDQSTAADGIDDRQRRVFGDSLQASSSRPTYYGQGAIAGMRTGTHSSTDDTIIDSVISGAYSAEKLAAADKDELKEVARVASTGVIPAAKLAQFTASHTILKNNATTAKTDSILSTRISKNRDNIDHIIAGTNPP